MVGCYADTEPILHWRDLEPILHWRGSEPILHWRGGFVSSWYGIFPHFSTWLDEIIFVFMWKCEITKNNVYVPAYLGAAGNSLNIVCYDFSLFYIKIVYMYVVY